MNPSNSSAPSVEVVARTWAAWDEFPGDRHRARARVEAIVTHVGLDHANQFQAHVAAARRAGLNVAAAVHSWEQK